MWFDLLKFMVLPAVFLAAAAILVGRRGRFEAIAVALGFVTAGVLFLAAYLASPRTREACSDCSEVWGRWWEPGLVIYLLGLLLFVWVLGLGIVSLVARRKRATES